MGPDEFNDPKTHIVIPNISTTQPQLNSTSTVIQNLQTQQGKVVTMPPLQNFVGASASESGAFPPDPTGAVGPNHYVHSVNSLVKIFDKTGGLLVGPVNLGAFLGSTSFGDPIVLYDQFIIHLLLLISKCLLYVCILNQSSFHYNAYIFKSLSYKHHFSNLLSYGCIRNVFL